MCDSEVFPAANPMNRREFTAISAAAMLAACAPVDGRNAGAGSLRESAVTFAAPGGAMDGIFLHPASGQHPGVILWPDIAGLRPAKLAMGRRLAEAGYAVLVANPYYRSVAGQQFADFAALRAVGFGAVADWREKNTPAAVMESAAAIVSWLDAQDAVDKARGIGVQGYCMTGTWTVLAAAAVPERVKAAAAFHPGSYLGEDPLAAVNLFASMASDSGALVAIARNDDAKAPEEKTAIAAAAAAANVPAKVAVYPADHGWTVPDSPAYDQPEAERAWSDLIALYAARL